MPSSSVWWLPAICDGANNHPHLGQRSKARAVRRLVVINPVIVHPFAYDYLPFSLWQYIFTFTLWLYTITPSLSTFTLWLYTFLFIYDKTPFCLTMTVHLSYHDCTHFSLWTPFTLSLNNLHPRPMLFIQHLYIHNPVYVLCLPPHTYILYTVYSITCVDNIFKSNTCRCIICI